MLPLLLGAALAGPPGPELLGPALAWTTVDDAVMGGRSASTATPTADGGLRFAGTLSLENNGGFASCRTVPQPLGLDDADALEVTVLGDGRTYALTLRRADVPLRAGSYRAPLPTTAGTPVTLTLALSDFSARSFGQPVPGAPPLDGAPDRIDQLGLLLADGRPGPFALTLLSVRPLRQGAAPPAPAAPALAGAVREIFAAAVARGVPAYNRGRADLCRAHYATAVESALLLGTEALAPADRERLGLALSAAARAPDAEAAWILRRAMDTVLVPAAARP